MYNDNYQSINGMKIFFYIRKSFALHDLISNFLSGATLSKNIIESDDLGARVLNLTLNEYFKRIKNFTDMNTNTYDDEYFKNRQ